MRDLDSLKVEFENYLAAQAFPVYPEGLYTPNTYFLKIGGKRLRPSLLLLACEIYSGKTAPALDAAIAIEYFHNFSLMHDDVMDHASVRRGYPTVHEKYGLNTAILSGDALLTYAYNYLAKVPQQYLKQVLDTFNRTAIEVCEGQQMDMDFENKNNVTEEEYLTMIRCKTSVLLAAAMQIGAIIGGASISDSGALYQYALSLGIAFQIQDDILDCYGSPEEVGKTPGGDILQNKKTLLYIRAKKLSDDTGDTTLSEWTNAGIDKKQDKLAAVLSIYNKYQVRSYAASLRDKYVEDSLNALLSVGVSREAKEVLSTLGKHLVYRSH
jgi:geranylgeranyl diphosphate synthase, type II